MGGMIKRITNDMSMAYYVENIFYPSKLKNLLDG